MDYGHQQGRLEHTDARTQPGRMSGGTDRQTAKHAGTGAGALHTGGCQTFNAEGRGMNMLDTDFASRQSLIKASRKRRYRSDAQVLKTIDEGSIPIPFSGCYIWLGSTARGYGKIRYKAKIMLIHRVVWLLNKGTIPEGLFVLHRCDTPPCVRVDHLFLGTPRDNTQDCMRKGRLRSGLPPIEQNSIAKLTRVQVQDIRQMYRQGCLTINEIAPIFGVHKETIRKIVRGRTWKI